MRIVLMLIAALAVTGGAGFFLLSAPEPQPQAVAVEAPPIPKTEVYAAAVDLAPGSIVRPEHLARVALDAAAVSAEMVVAAPDGEAALLGSVARQTLAKGVPIARSTLVAPGDRGFLAAVLPKGRRAISIPITEVAGLSGLVMPGDRVDIILTYAVTSASVDLGRDIRASETVLSNIRVLALDQRLDQSNQGPQQAGVEDTPIARTATLQVTPREAEIVTLATTLGDLSLVLNSVHDGGEFENGDRSVEAGPLPEDTPRTLTLDSDVTSLLRPKPQADEDAGQAMQTIAEQMRRIQIVRGASSGAVELGQDVARPDADAPVVAAAPDAPPAEDAPAQ